MRLSFLSCLLFLAIFSVVTVDGQCRADQQSLLTQLKNSLVFSSISSAKLVKWNQSVDCCRWAGVTCDGKGGVDGLDLSTESITGGLNDTSPLFSLQSLRSLNLSFNNFNYSQIPSGIGKLANLAYLNLSNAQFGGQVPIEVSDLKRLNSLDLSTLFRQTQSLRLENPNISLVVKSLTELVELKLDNVLISSSEGWSQALSSSLPNLRVLSLANCNLSGPVDSSMSNLKHLSHIQLEGNNFSTQVPDFFGGFSKLTSLKLSSCGFFGKLPGKVFQLPTLETLDFSINKHLEVSLLDFPDNGSLRTLDLSNTNSSGELPESIGKLKLLSKINLGNCRFSGSIPRSVINLTQLVSLDLSFNQFNGTVPSFAMLENLTEIILSHNGLTGELPTSWKGLNNLVSLDLGNNLLTGKIPSSLFSLPLLQQIQLSNNWFSGQLDVHPNLKLEVLDLSYNNLSGLLPMSISEVKGLNILLLNHNNFKGYIKLEWIQNFANLTSLDLSYNNLSVVDSGNSSDLLSFPQLRTLKLASCGLKAFPDLRNQSKLTVLDLSNNRIPGSIPTWIFGNGSLTQLNLSHNSLVNLQEPYFVQSLTILDLHLNNLKGNLPKLPPSAFYLDYSANNFTSSLPADIGTNLSFTVFLSLSNNGLSGPIPISICKAAYLQVLDLSNNELSRSIPECLIEMGKRLGVLNLKRNNLSGTVANAFPENCALETLDLSGNQLEGKVPRSLVNCTMLEILDMGNNHIADVYPCHLKNISTLRVLVLRSNDFNGSIGCPDNKGPWQKLQIVDLAYNNFGGEIPHDCLETWKAMFGEEEGNMTHDRLRFDFLQLNKFYYQDATTVTFKGLELEFVNILTIFTSIDISCNKFQGPLPEVIGKFKGLYVLNMSHNAFTGHIPSVYGNLAQLESLDLSNNDLNGEIPVQLTNLNFLSVLNLSNNQLTGKIPTGSQFQTFTADAYTGNPGLCGPPLKGCTTTKPKLPSTEKNAFDWQFIFTGIGFGIGAGAIVAPIIFWSSASECLDDFSDKILLVILPMVGLTYTSRYWKINAKENLNTADTESSDEDSDIEDKQSVVRFCVFCSKLDNTTQTAIHDPNCTCHDIPSST